MKKLKESKSLSRLLRFMKAYDVAVITAFRGRNENCVHPQEDIPEGEEYTKKQNLQRNKILLSKLLKLGYGVTKINGVYIERYGDDSLRQSKENSFFVVNLHNDPHFVKNIIRLGMEFCQDSVLISKGGYDTFYLVGTNNSDWPGLMKRFKAGDKVVFNTMHQFMSTLKGKKGFAIIDPEHPEANPRLEHVLMTYKKLSNNSKRIVNELSMRKCCKNL